MALVQVGVKMDTSIKDKIKTLVDEGKYRDMTDFALKAILEKLEREEIRIDLFEKLNELELKVRNHEVKIRELESK